MKKIALALLLLTSFSARAMGEVTVGDVVTNVAHKASQVRSYATKMSLTDLTKAAEGGEHFAVKWEASYAAPDRYSVFQTAREQSGEVYDRWISIGEDTYVQMGGWFKSSRGKGRDGTNRLLSLHKWANILTKNSAVLTVKSEGGGFVIEGAPADAKDFLAVELGKDLVGDLKVYIDAAYRIDKAVLRITGEADGEKADLVYEQTFSDYDAHLVIEKPRDAVDLE